MDSPLSSPDGTRPALQPSDKPNRLSNVERTPEDKNRLSGQEPIRAYRMELGGDGEPGSPADERLERLRARTSDEAVSSPAKPPSPSGGRRGAASPRRTRKRSGSRSGTTSGRGSRSSGRSSGERETRREITEDEARVMLETVQHQCARLKETYKAQLAVEKADRRELERLLSEEQAKVRAVEREKESLAVQTRQREEREAKEKLAREKAELEAQRAKLEADMQAWHRQKAQESPPRTKPQVSERPLTPRHPSRKGSSSRARSEGRVSFSETPPELVEYREASPTRSRLGSAVNTAMSLGGAVMTAAVAVPLVGALLAVDGIKYVRGGAAQGEQAGAACRASGDGEAEAAAPPAPSSFRRRWSVANDGREVWAKIVDVD